jgi:hypothetical protein
VIQDFDRTIERLLQAEFGRPLPFDVSFAAPDRAFAPVSSERSTLNCYLFDIGEDRALRSGPRVAARDADGVVRLERPPLRLKLSYCLTAWSPAQRDGGRDPALDEHALLGGVLLALLRHPVVPRDAIEGPLAGEEPLPTTVLLSEGPRMREFWNALGGTLRPSIEYTATITVPFEAAVDATTVSSIRVGVAGGPPLHLVGGTVRRAVDPKRVVPGAWVRLAETGDTVETDATGRFVFARIREGTYTLAARAEGFREASRTVTVPGGTYDLDLAAI